MPTSRPFDVVVIGNAGVDTNVYLYGEDVDWSVEANFTQNIDYLGQAGGYASRGYAALGRRTAFIGALGDDHNGRFVREGLEREGIDTSGIFLDPQGTARSVNVMYRDGRRKNFYDGRGHMELEPDLAAFREILAGARLAHFNIPNWARRLLPLARELGVTIACDLQDVVRADDPYRQDFIAAADVLFFSTANQASPESLAWHLLEQRPELVIVMGMGPQGCAVATRDGLSSYPPVELDLPVVDTNGAGDGLAVGFLTSYVLDRLPLAEAARRGQIVARYTCAQRAPKASLLDAATLESLAGGTSSRRPPLRTRSTRFAPET